MFVLSSMDVLHGNLLDATYRTSCLVRELLSAGRRGRKTGRGVYQCGA
jgi:3-hydroxyacyl-CoA dehydrogenase